MPRSLLLAIVCVALGAALPAAADAATGPYEPNDTAQTAAGPLSAGAPIAATIETTSDVDWHYLYTAGPGRVDVAVALTSCGAASPGPTCSNVAVSVIDGDGRPVGSAIANTIGEVQHVFVQATARERYVVGLRQSGVSGAGYLLTVGSTGGLTSAAPGEPLPPASQPAPLPAPVQRFTARFETSYVGSPRHPRKRRIRGLTVQNVQPGSVIVVRCVQGCAKRYRKTVTARGASRRLGGLPMRLQRDTRLRIEVRRSGFVGRYRDYTFARVPAARIRASGCTSPYDFSPIFCAPDSD